MGFEQKTSSSHLPMTTFQQWELGDVTQSLQASPHPHP